MKRITSLMFIVIMMAVLTTVVSITSCKKESQSLTPDKISEEATLSNSAKNSAPLKVDGMQAYLRVRNSAGQMVNAATTGNPLLFTRRGSQSGTSLIELKAPDGHQLRLAEFKTVSGWADFKCINTGTHGVFHMKGLIPNGVYTLWIFAFGSPGPPNLMGAGPFGELDGSNNSFVADAEGTASISITMADLSGIHATGNCLSSVYEFHVLAAYHPDQKTYGSMPGNFWVGQIFFPVLGIKL